MDLYLIPGDEKGDALNGNIFLVLDVGGAEASKSLEGNVEKLRKITSKV